MKYILATDSFKGCMSSQEVENIIAGVLDAKGIDTLCLPMSDGGDGMLSAFTTATGGTLEPVYIQSLEREQPADWVMPSCSISEQR